jgi:short-subunit dehydrogenase
MNIVITGGSKGLGKAIASEFANDKQGHSLFLCARNKDDLEQTRRELQGRFPRTNIFTRACNIADKKDLVSFTEMIFANSEKVDILVNNAGIFFPGSVHNEEEGILEKSIEVNLYGTYHLTRLLLPGMIKKQNGHIFNICSIASLNAYPNGGAYSISKFAMYGFSKNLREELKPHGVKVTHVLPGAAYTDSWSGSGIDPKRIMEASDISKMVYTAAHLSPQACVEEIVIRPQLGDL